MNMHPDMVHTMVAQRQSDLLHEAAAQRLSRLARRTGGAHRHGRRGRRPNVPTGYDLAA